MAGTFLGYGEGHRIYRVEDGRTGNVILSHHVNFNDSVFPAKSVIPDPASFSEPTLFTIEPNAQLPAKAPIDESSNQPDSDDSSISELLSSESTPQPSPIPSESKDESFDPTTLTQLESDSSQSAKYHPAQEIIGEISEQNIIQGRCSPRHEAFLA